jgi:hypothetical protein
LTLEVGTWYPEDLGEGGLLCLVSFFVLFDPFVFCFTTVHINFKLKIEWENGGRGKSQEEGKEAEKKEHLHPAGCRPSAKSSFPAVGPWISHCQTLLLTV